ncbi:protein PHYTOCHROME KINASE SUBSTRATE 1-like [Neltuma alba]|uniref:protein PHYTOCHROME KINASE SUBSTRATE 1-like n=1 Tax=Neltuma alba TaxID=207710 RepID=UPI0010A49EC6|nr:protein PHYTOCHROME KINASE SUBSTRATE 1-like [Prosopis alba]
MLKDSVTKVTITSAANRGVYELLSLNSQNKNSHHRKTSFSSYLDRIEGTFEKKLADSSKKVNSFTDSREDYPVHMVQKKGEDEEIGVFSAEKYFNGGVEDGPGVSNNMPARKFQYHHRHPHQKEKQEADLEETRKSKVLPIGTPSVHSESSWNSQSALLRTALKNSSRNSRKKVQGKSLLSNLGCKCSCSDKDSVDVRGTASCEISFGKNASFGVTHGKTSSPKKSFETVYAGLANKPENMKIPPEYELEKPTKSLELFGSSILECRSKSLSFDKRLTAPSSSSWNPPKSGEIDLSANSGGNNINDAASDASSDLFEIESFTGAKSKPYLASQASDAANSGCVTPTTCYAPSEASIDWSVVTSSAAEQSVLPDFEEQRSVTTMMSPIRSSTFGSSTNGKSKANRDMQRRRSSNLLGCKSHRAVRVAGDAFIRHQKASPNVPQVKKMGSFDPKHGDQHVYGSQQRRQRSHTPSASQLLYD